LRNKINRCLTNNVATDHSKFSRQAIVRLGELKDVDYLFTDDVPKQIADYLENSNTTVNFGRTSYFYHLQITNFVLLFSK